MMKSVFYAIVLASTSITGTTMLVDVSPHDLGCQAYAGPGFWNAFMRFASGC